jgi:PiT family inorganic phosphate transporter
MHFFQSAAQNFGTIPFAQLSVTVWLLLALALLFDFLNGFHDAANSIATVVSTRVLSPHVAVVWAAFFNFVAFLIFELRVADRMGKGIINPDIVNNRLIAATLIAACAWDIITWYWGLPTSSSHALIGGLVGSAWMIAGYGALQIEGILTTFVFLILAPIIGGLLGFMMALGIAWLFRHATPRRVDKIFRRGQLVSAAFYSLGHGGNDAQKTMGIIFVLLIAASRGGEAFHKPAHVPTEVVLACHVAMALGTLFGGWRIVKTMGQRIIRLRPVDGFCAETGAAVTLVMTIFGGVPVSTTHTITGAIMGVGSMKRLSAVRWGIAGRVIWAWILTIPACALLAAITFWVLHGLY